MDKIYSRKRFLIPKLSIKKNKKFRINNDYNNSFNNKGMNNEKINDLDKAKVKKLIKFFAIILIAVCIANRVISSIEPIVNASCKETARIIAIKICNEQTSLAMRKL